MNHGMLQLAPTTLMPVGPEQAMGSEFADARRQTKTRIAAGLDASLAPNRSRRLKTARRVFSSLTQPRTTRSEPWLPNLRARAQNTSG
jgi:hypothetical protein